MENEKGIEPIKLRLIEDIDIKRESPLNPFAHPLSVIMSTIKATHDINKVEEAVLQAYKDFGSGRFVCSVEDYKRSFGLP